MARIYSWDGRLLRALLDGFLRCLAVQHRHMRAGLQLVLSVDDDLLIGLEAGIDERLAAADLSDLNRSAPDGIVVIDDVHVSSARSLLHRRCRDGQAIVPCIDK